MNASIDPAFHNFPTPSSKVDYALFHNLAHNDVKTAEALAQFQLIADGSVNHTSFGPLRQHPITISIETKRHGGDRRKAEVQMATWYAVNWAFFELQAGADINNLTFLPGIIVQGYD